jgi:glycosyltransferase involved in cell wall biosynthesis
MSGIGDPEVTVVVPVWDRYVSVLGEAVESVSRQAAVRAVVLLIDNASTQPLRLLPAGVQVMRLPSRVSVGAARNAGLALVRTEFTLFMDADDVMLDGALSAMLARLRDAEWVSACSCAVEAWNPLTGSVAALNLPSRRTRLLAPWPALYRMYAVLSNRMPTTGCVLMRTTLAMQAGGFADADYGEDWPLNVGLAFRGAIAFLPWSGRLLRVHPDSLRSRPWERVDVARSFAALRGRLRADPATPWLVRRCLPLIALLHRWQIRRLTPGGVLKPGTANRLVGSGSALPSNAHPKSPLELTTIRTMPPTSSTLVPWPG